MKSNFIVRWIFPSVLLFCFLSCTQDAKQNNKAENFPGKPDTILVKHQRTLNRSYEVGFLSKSFTYYWLVGKDTLDLSVSASEYGKDSTLSVSTIHSKPIMFTEVLDKISECFSLIREDFRLSGLRSLYFESPIYYPDLAKELSAAYEQQFGRKNIGYERLNRLLLSSNLNKRLDSFVNPLGKKVERYSIEKFHLTDKKSFTYYLPSADISGYPEFSLHGMGLYVQLEDTAK